jgi:hypothetical protein
MSNNEHADLVAALNILRAGHARLACEVSAAPRSASSRNQLSAALWGGIRGILVIHGGEDVNMLYGCMTLKRVAVL